VADPHDEVRTHYAEAARAAAGRSNCCRSAGAADCCDAVETSPGAAWYGGVVDELPEGAVVASLGCGNPAAVAELRPGEYVLDLGSGGGIDVLLSARRVGPSGKVFGLDMTDEMIGLARRHQEEAGVKNVRFLKGYIEDIPLPDASIDVIISNCVINLSPEKPAVFAEMYRVLRPGGRIAVGDIVAEDHLTLVDRARRGSLVGCIAGALCFAEYRSGLEVAGFADVSVVPTHEVVDSMHGAIIKAWKPKGDGGTG